ncbi:MAG: DUF4082 domain-containing protein [Methylocella sp.]
MRFWFAACFWMALGASGAFAQNAIVTENQLPGTPQSTWDLSQVGSQTIEGFTDNISVNHGTTINFKVKTATNHWKIDIYRLGYYQGNGARLITTITKTAAQTQPAPIHDATTGQYDAGNWAVTASWAVPASAVSGVYLAKLTDLNTTTNQNQIPFIVRADESTSDIVFQTSDTTWHAYNGWYGGDCTSIDGPDLYGASASVAGPGGDSAPGRAYKVSYNRPIATRNYCGTYADTTDFLFGAEYAALNWLEQNGYNVSYIAEVDTSRSGALLQNHKIFISAGHDEYWDTVARAKVLAARKAGVNLAFLSGNEVFWKTRWEPSIDGTSTPYRALVCYKETRHNAPLDPLDASPTWEWTGSWEDPRFSPPADGGQPENALTGEYWLVDAFRTDAITVPYPMTLLRFWRNTAVAATPSGQTATLTQNILGYEWDAAPDNGFSPAGLIDLSSTTLAISQDYMRDYGSTDGSGTATHNLTYYKDPSSGALVFGAGTVFWSWGLSSVHDGTPTPTDPNIQQVTVNVFADMGVQPATLQSGLMAAVKSTDTTPPASGISSPLNGASYTAGQPVLISGFASDIGGKVAGVEVSVDGGVTWHRASGTTSWTYTWVGPAGSYTVASRATDDSLNTETPLSSGPSFSVTPTGGTTIFSGVSVPNSQTTDDPNPIEIGVKFSSSTAATVTGFLFYKNSIDIAPHTAELWNASGTMLATATFANESVSGWQQVNLATPVAIAANTTYVVSSHTGGFYSASGNYFTAPVTNGSLTATAGVYTYGTAISFPTSSFNASNYWVDVVVAATAAAPAITSALTASGTVGTPFNYPITATNNPTSFNAAGLPAGLSVNTTTGVIAGTPTAAGTSSVTLSATNATGTGSATLTLEVIAAAGSSGFSASTVPGTVTVNDPNSVELGVKFSASTAGSITALRFYKGPQNTGTHTGNLWSATGTLLASAPFTNETASGWQQVNLPTPVGITAGTTYIASYHSNGFYSADGNYFATAVTNGPLTFPASASSGGNGVYAYGGTSIFPSSTYNAANYYVDVVFSASSGTAAPAITSALTAGGTVGTSFSYTITATNNPTSFNASGLPAGLSVNTTTGVIGGTPTAAGMSSVTLSATNAAGTSSATLALTINAAGGSSLFSTSDVPATVTVNDTSPVELGVQFFASTAGHITSILFYKGPQNTGAHTANLWSATGTLLASAPFTNETASGWQQVNLPTPVAITAGTTYFASYHTNGFYSASGNYFATATTNGPLTAPASASSGGNGVYAYGGTSTFPVNNYNATNYWVDVILQ